MNLGDRAVVQREGGPISPGFGAAAVMRHVGSRCERVPRATLAACPQGKVKRLMIRCVRGCVTAIARCQHRAADAVSGPVARGADQRVEAYPQVVAFALQHGNAQVAVGDLFVRPP